jgi:hypothetical protein
LVSDLLHDVQDEATLRAHRPDLTDRLEKAEAEIAALSTSEEPGASYPIAVNKAARRSSRLGRMYMSSLEGSESTGTDVRKRRSVACCRCRHGNWNCRGPYGDRHISWPVRWQQPVGASKC